MLCTFVYLGTPFFEHATVRRNAVLISGEESEQDLEIRQWDINDYYRLDCTEQEGLHLVSLKGQDMTCFYISKAGTVATTPMWKAIREQILDVKAGIAFLDHYGLMVAGPEGDRHATGTVMSYFGGLAEDARGAVVFAQHPSRASASDYSGNSGFYGGVRCMWKIEKKEQKEGEPSRRDLRIVGANYAAERTVELEFRRGLFVPKGFKSMSVVEQLQMRERQRQARETFLAAVATLTASQTSVSNNASKTYAPKVMAERGLTNGFTAAELKTAMNELLNEGAIKANVELPWKTTSRHGCYGLALNPEG
jgi:AAA domain